MDHALPLAAAPAEDPSFAVSGDATAPLRTRVRRLFVIAFDDLDDLDLSHPTDFESHVSELFVRGAHARM